jgi:hypothetical protein
VDNVGKRTIGAKREVSEYFLGAYDTGIILLGKGCYPLEGNTVMDNLFQPVTGVRERIQN